MAPKKGAALMIYLNWKAETSGPDYPKLPASAGVGIGSRRGERVALTLSEVTTSFKVDLSVFSLKVTINLRARLINSGVSFAINSETVFKNLFEV